MISSRRTPKRCAYGAKCSDEKDRLRRHCRAGDRAVDIADRAPPFGVERFCQCSKPCIMPAHWFAPSERGSGHSTAAAARTDEHTSELQSTMRLMSAVLCLTKT